MLFPNLVGTLYLWLMRYRQRHQLKRMEPWQLRDIGIHPRDAAAESRKPCWKA